VRRASLALLAVVVVALGLAGAATGARLGIFQTAGSVAREPLDPAGIGGATPLDPFPGGLCPPEAERANSSGSSADFGGVCPFHQGGRVYCRSSGDDFYVLLRRALPGGGSLSLYVDVEFYRGPGSYRDVQVLLLVQDAQTIYQWSNFRAQATVAAREGSLRLPRTQLGVESGRAGSGSETVSGTLACGGTP